MYKIKFMRKLFYIGLILLIHSCKKEKISIQGTEIPGKYEWYISYNGPGELYSQMSSADKYGILIKDNGKVVYYKNSEIIIETKIIRTHDNGVSTDLILENYNSLEYSSDKLLSQKIPYVGIENQFLKIK